MRGHGRSGKPNHSEGYESKLYADDFSTVLRAFKLHRPIVLGWYRFHYLLCPTQILIAFSGIQESGRLVYLQAHHLLKSEAMLPYSNSGSGHCGSLACTHDFRRSLYCTVSLSWTNPSRNWYTFSCWPCVTIYFRQRSSPSRGDIVGLRNDFLQ